MDLEIWRDIPGYEGRYQASNMGRIKSLARYVPSKNGVLRFVRERILKQHIKDKCGHLAVSLGKNNQGFPVNRAVALAFIGLPNPKEDVMHINGNPQDNRPYNLKYGSRSENILDVYNHNGRWRRLSIDDVYEIRFYLLCDYKGRDIAHHFDLSETTICDIKHRRRYGWLK